MKEVDIQALVCTVVNEAGGFAFKLQDRFVGGRADLLIKLPDDRAPAGFLEIKQRAYPATDAQFKLDVTHLQDRFLAKASVAGVPTGVASFLQRGTGSGLTLWLHVMTWRTASYGDRVGMAPYTSHRRAHVELGRKGQREGVLLSTLFNWVRDWKAER